MNCVQGFPVLDAGIARDNISDLTSCLAAALQNTDILVTTGGVSMGDRDLLRQVQGDLLRQVQRRPTQKGTMGTYSGRYKVDLFRQVPRERTQTGTKGILYLDRYKGDLIRQVKRDLFRNTHWENWDLLM